MPTSSGSEEIWDSFFFVDPLAVAGADMGDLWEWSDQGFFPVDPTNEAYRIGVNYVIYAVTPLSTRGAAGQKGNPRAR